MRFANKEVITGVSFAISFVIFIMSSYGVGKAETDDDKTLKEFAIASIFISIAGMLAAWFIQYGLLTPPDNVFTRSTQSIYLFLMYLIPVALGLSTVSASAYGLGKHEKDPHSIEYKVSLVFFTIGVIISVLSASVWVSGNYTAKKYEVILSSKDKVLALGQEAIKDLGTCKAELQKMDTDAMGKRLSELAKLSAV